MATQTPQDILAVVRPEAPGCRDAVMSAGAVCARLLVQPAKVIRNDESDRTR